MVGTKGAKESGGKSDYKLPSKKGKVSRAGKMGRKGNMGRKG